MLKYFNAIVTVLSVLYVVPGTIVLLMIGNLDFMLVHIVVVYLCRIRLGRWAERHERRLGN